MKSLIVTALSVIAIVCASGNAVACTISTAPISFGTYASNDVSPITGNGSVTVNCADTIPFQIGMDGGLNPATPNRRMINGGVNFLTYQIYQDVSNTIIWGNTLDTDTLSGTGTGVDQNYTVYGKLSGSQSVPAGSYTDTVTATVNY